MSEYMKGIGKKVAGALVVAGLVIGWKMYQRSDSRQEMRAELSQLCEREQKCLAVVEKHADKCHDDAFSFGGRRSAAKLDMDVLTACVNSQAGEEIFSAK